MVAIGIGVGVVFGGAVPAPFTPLDLSPALWLDASDATTITASSGAVSEWRDRSGNARHVSQGTAAAQPTTGAATLNGLNVIGFVNDRLSSNAFGVADPCVIFMVLNRTGTAVQVIYDNNSGQVNSRLITYWDSSSWRYYQGTIVNSSTNTTTWARITTVHNQASSLMRINGVQVATGNPGTQDNATFRLGDNDSAVQPFVGSIAEFVIVNGTLTAQQITDMETYLATKWGI